ncbi:MAG: class I SAM-dependent methyltransferase [Lachnospiraceae bacterium]|nr:class I SAM-dependent methyltransferase [Lachnospiraceae bacterium]
MITASDWKDYEVLDASDGEKLERWGDYILVRPDPQVIWTTDKSHPGWKKPNARYHRSSKGGGEWEFINLPEEWRIKYKELIFNLKPFAFKHTGIFPEQAANWDWAADLIYKETNKRISAEGSEGSGSSGGMSRLTNPVKLLNLFAYTGGATVSALKAGASVTHVDASKGMVNWAKENASSSDVIDRQVRWLVDDCLKFTEREIRRGNKYDAIIMDPPSYGRGPKGEIWKIEDCVYDLVRKTSELLSDKPLFFLINSYTTGLQPGVLKAMTDLVITPKFGGKSSADELGLPISGSNLVLPCGACGRWQAE